MFRRLTVPFLFLALSLPGVLTLAPSVARATQMLDVMFLLDGSGSITDSDFIRQADAARSIATILAAGVPGGGSVPDPGNPGSFLPVDLLPADLAVGVVQFSTSVTLELGLTGNLAAFNNTLDNLVQQGGQTNHAGAFAAGAAQLAANGRSGATQVMILLTDGLPNAPGGNPLADAIAQADLAKSSGIQIYAIGIGNQIGAATLAEYASAPTADYTALFADYTAAQSAGDAVATQFLAADTLPPIASVPAPAPMAVLGVGLAGFAAMRRRRGR